jgi:hypothetical protein
MWGKVIDDEDEIGRIFGWEKNGSIRPQDEERPENISQSGGGIQGALEVNFGPNRGGEAPD